MSDLVEEKEEELEIQMEMKLKIVMMWRLVSHWNEPKCESITCFSVRTGCEPIDNCEEDVVSSDLK